jgi:hypothetical protein
MQILDSRGFPVEYNQDYFDREGISQPSTDSSVNTASPIYNLSGQRTQQNSRLKPGIYIQQGKKIIIRR